MPQKGRAKGGYAKISAVDEDDAAQTWQLSPKGAARSALEPEVMS